MLFATACSINADHDLEVTAYDADLVLEVNADSYYPTWVRLPREKVAELHAALGAWLEMQPCTD